MDKNQTPEERQVELNATIARRQEEAERRECYHRAYVESVKQDKEKGYSNAEIAKRFSLSESTVRKLLKES